MAPLFCFVNQILYSATPKQRSILFCTNSVKRSAVCVLTNIFISWIIHIVNCYLAFLTVPEVSLRFLCLYSAGVLHPMITYEVVSKFILISNQSLHFKKTQKVITDRLTTYVALYLSVKTGVHFLLCVCISVSFFI